MYIMIKIFESILRQNKDLVNLKKLGGSLKKNF